MGTQFTVQQNEYLEAHRAALKKMPRSPRWMSWLLCVVYFVGLVFCIGVLHDRENNPDLYTFGCIMLVWASVVMVLVGLANRQVLRRQYKRRFEDVELSFEYDETTISTNTSHFESRVQWEAVQGWAETPTTLVLLLDEFVFYVLPKRVFAAGALDALRATLKAKISPMKR